jgi:hemerythrin-like metal-binding protein
MKIIEWDDKMSVGVDKIDEQHKELIRILRDFTISISSNSGEGNSKEALKRLYDYTFEHFEAEEYLMSANSYPDMNAHFDEHRKLYDKVIKLSEAAFVLENADSMEIAEFMSYWLKWHILITDKKLGEFLNAQVS